MQIKALFCELGSHDSKFCELVKDFPSFVHPLLRFIYMPSKNQGPDDKFDRSQ
jgi:hypothetical protein